MSLRTVVAWLVGVVTALAVVVGIEALADVVYPTPDRIDLSDADDVREYVGALPVGAFLFVLGAWIAGTFSGGLVAAFIARSSPHLAASGIGVVILLAAAANLAAIPHPPWFVWAAMIGVPLAAWTAGIVASRTQRIGTDTLGRKPR
jgi:hypothetical protein